MPHRTPIRVVHSTKGVVVSGSVTFDTRFDWDFPVDQQPDTPYMNTPTLRAAVWFWVMALVLLSVGGGFLWLLQRDAERSEREARAGIRQMLDLAAVACRTGDGDLFFTLQQPDDAWQAALLRPDQTAAYCAGPRVTAIREQGAGYQASIEWIDGNEPQQRPAFFQMIPGGVLQTPPTADFWGERRQSRHAWGRMIYTEADEPYAAAVAKFVEQVVDLTCQEGCLPERLSFTLDIRPDFKLTVAPDVLQIPSPQLLALSEDGQPAPVFWEQLEAQIIAHLTPGTIRFAVPPYLQQVIHFEEAARAFNRQNPDLTVEIVPLDHFPEEPGPELAAFDGAAYTPTAAMIAAGQVLDLTDLMSSDPAFDAVDFYEQVWQGSGWRGRMWLVPHAGQMRLIYFDRGAYQAAGLSEPSLRWTWDEIGQDMNALMAISIPRAGFIGWNGEWAFLDATRDTLFSYAYNHQHSCGESVPARCEASLGPVETAAALSWYQQMVEATGLMPGLSGLSSAERVHLMANRQGAARHAAIWVDDLVNYEHHLQSWPIGVVPFPSSSRFDGNTPIWIHGSFISADTDRPLDVWRWLVFLSYRPLNGPLRYVPARPSLAVQTGYWDVLPIPLREAMRTAFPLARPVKIADREQMTGELLATIADGRLTVFEATQRGPDFRWFGR
jgi:ABC-type glycerol-3-phosphate transport system substrate-binding protein